MNIIFKIIYLTDEYIKLTIVYKHAQKIKIKQNKTRNYKSN